MATATKPLPRSRVQDAFRAALRESGIPKRACLHTLRHAWATHRLATGVHRRLIQAYLGHHSPATTALYTPLPRQAQELAGIASNPPHGGSVMVDRAAIFRTPGPA
jgi:site-specific recombinase XerD